MLALILSLVVSASVAAKDISFTITVDDGPNSWTMPLAKRLVADEIPATWFIIGTNFSKARQADLDYLATNSLFILGNHSGCHDFNRLKSSYWFANHDIMRLNHYIEKRYGRTMLLFRPPYGVAGNEILSVVLDFGFTIVPWHFNFDERLNENMTTKEVLGTIDRYMVGRDNYIILLHSNSFTLKNYDTMFGRWKQMGHFESFGEGRFNQ